MIDKKWLTTEEAAELENVTVDCITKRIRRGNYPSELIKKVSRDIGGYEYLLNSSLIKNNKIKKGVKMVRAKFVCKRVEEDEFNKRIHCEAVHSLEGENADFVKATPSGNLEMMLDLDSKASEVFKPGKEYYLDFTEVE